MQDSSAALLDDLKDLVRLRQLDRRLAYHLVFVPDGGRAEAVMYLTVGALVEGLRERVGQRGQAFVFYGERWHTNRGPNKFLLPPAGQGDRIPLVQSETDLEPDEDGGWAEDGPEDALPRS